MTRRTVTQWGYLRHEVLHMAAFLANVVDQELVGHEIIQENPEWHMMAESAHRQLYELYQAIGANHLDDLDNP